MNINISYPSLTSNYSVVFMSDLIKKLELDRFLVPVLFLHNDDVFLNVLFMACLFKVVNYSPKDTYIFLIIIMNLY